MTLEEAKKHLNVEAAYTDDDTYIGTLIDVAEMKVATELCMDVEGLAAVGGGDTLPVLLKQAILLSIGGYYVNRDDITTVQTRPLAQGSLHIVQLFRDYSL